MGDAIGSVQAVCRAILSPALWFGLLRKLLSWEGLCAVVLLLPMLPVMFVVFMLPPWVGCIPQVYWLYWAAPAIIRLVAPVVAHHVIAPKLPTDLQEREPPEARVYRHWWVPPLAMGVLLFLGWSIVERMVPAGIASSAAITLLVSMITTGVLVRSALCTCFPMAMIERSLKQLRWGWYGVVLAITLGVWMLNAAASAALLPSPQSLIQRGVEALRHHNVIESFLPTLLLWVLVQAVITVVVAVVLAHLGAAKLLREHGVTETDRDAQLETAAPGDR